MGKGTSKEEKMKGYGKAAVLLLLCIPMLLWAVRDIHIADISAALLRLTPASLLGLALMNVLILLLFARRWWLVMLALGYRLPFLSLLIYRLAGFGVSYFTPGPQFGGEPLQVHLLHKHNRVPGATALAGITVDKLLEMLVNFSFLVFGLLLVFKAQLLSVSELLLLLSAGLLAFPVAYIFLIRQRRLPVSWLLTHLSFLDKRMPAFNRARSQVLSAEEQVASLISNNVHHLMGALGLSVITWVLLIFEYWLTLQVFGIRLEPAQVIIMLTAARIAFLLPVPAGLGALEAGQVAAMQLLGLDPAMGISVSLLIRARDFSLGSLGLWLGGISTYPFKPSAGVQTVPIPLERRDKA
jgi:glycosyltransferase 2 family protein